ncbi:MAG: flagellar biosynthetic protein FliO [Phycisphaerales bacterium]|nr:flagellar biosynthetic protein FliO [Phycisphaerales bacterium]
MAPTAPSISRCLAALVAIILLGLSSPGHGDEASVSPDLTVPAREHLPLGPPPVAVEAGETTSGGGFMPGVLEMARVGGALAAVVALLLGLRYVLRRMSGMPLGRRPEGVVHVHARYPVARGQQIVLVQVGPRIIVAHQGGGSMRTLSEITDPAEVANLRASLAAGGRDVASSTGDFKQDLAMATAESSDRVVDLTRRPPVEPVRATRSRRLPGWRSGS